MDPLDLTAILCVYNIVRSPLYGYVKVGLSLAHSLPSHITYTHTGRSGLRQAPALWNCLHRSGKSHEHSPPACCGCVQPKLHGQNK